MCYRVRQQQAGTELGATPPVSGFDRQRARWVGAVGATLVGGLALGAALTVSPSAAPTLSAQQAGAAAPIATRTTSVPVGGGVEVGAGVDDGVPSSSDTAKASIGNCHHGL
jgi:hypothetical protein